MARLIKDKELLVLADIEEALDELNDDEAARARVVGYLVARHGGPGSVFAPKAGCRHSSYGYDADVSKENR